MVEKMIVQFPWTRCSYRLCFLVQNQELEEKKNIEDFSQFHWFGKKFYKSVSETHGKHLDLHLIFIKYILKEAEFEEQKHLDAQYQQSNFKKNEIT